MRVSVVVPTYGRPDALRRCLDALARQRRAPDEVCVVLRREDTPSHAPVREAAGAGLPVREVHVERPGLVAALNAGFDAAGGDVCAFTDDDAEPWQDWLERLEQAFDRDSRVGAVGGRDWVYHEGQLDGGAEPIVGIVSWYGRVTGNHHVGTGPPRDVHVLKGVNMAFRRDVFRRVRFDTRLIAVGTEHHSELGACLGVLREGGRIVYDPAIAVNHRPAARVAASDRTLAEAAAIRAAVHNETLALLEHFGPVRRLVFVGWAFSVGTSTAPGLAQVARLALTRRRLALRELRAAWAGRALGLRSWRSARRAPSVLAIGHSGYGADRAKQLLAGRTRTRVCEAGGGSAGVRRALAAVLRSRARVIYLVDLGASTTAAALLARLLGRRVIVDTGDLAYELARSTGRRSPLGLLLVRAGEAAALRAAHHVVVRGRAHVRHLGGRPATHVPDLPPPAAAPVPGAHVRARLGLSDAEFVVGLVGSLNYAPRLGIGYGWDLVEALSLVPPGVCGLVVGDGAGRPLLERRARELGVLERMAFAGVVPPGEVSAYVGAMDAAISTQTNDPVGAVRTTGKLPLYLACGCPVIATDVGEAAHLLGPLGWVLPYEGVVDRSYPGRLAARICEWAADSEGQADRRRQALALAENAFDIADLRRRLAAVLDA